MRQTILTILAATLVGAGLIATCRQIHTRTPSPSHEEPVVLDQPAPPESFAIQQRTLAKRQITRRLIAERIPLLDAAEMFRQANGEEGMKYLRFGALGGSIREKLCRQVIDYVLVIERESQGATQPVPDIPVADALQAELNHLLAVGELSPEQETE
jgi:hypothetical protein